MCYKNQAQSGESLIAFSYPLNNSCKYSFSFINLALGSCILIKDYFKKVKWHWNLVGGRFHESTGTDSNNASHASCSFTIQKLIIVDNIFFQLTGVISKTTEPNTRLVCTHLNVLFILYPNMTKEICKFQKNVEKLLHIWPVVCTWHRCRNTEFKGWQLDAFSP